MVETPMLNRELFVDGHWSPASHNRRVERYSPADGRLVGSFALADVDDVQRAIRAARQAFDHGPWPRMPAAERAEVLLKAAALLEQNREPMAMAECLTSGAPLEQCRWMMSWVVDLLKYYAGIARSISGQTFDFGSEQLGLVLTEPVGVVSLIAPWNFPLNQAAWKIAPALAAGCTMVVKPDSKTPVTTLDLAELFTQAGLPAGVLNVVVGDPAEIGEVLTGHPDIDLVSITGSTATGKIVMRNAANTVKRVNLELGGKSPNIVFPDADLEQAAQAAAWAVFWRSGQICTAGSRLLLHESIHDEFVERLKQKAMGMTIANPLNAEAVLGPVISAEHLSSIERYVKGALAEGATAVLGGERLRGESFDNGSYFPPTILVEVAPGMTIAQEEVFGPVVAVMKFRDAEEALRLANQTLFGLASAVWTNDLNLAFRMAKGLKAGTVWINNYGVVKAEMPVGGYKMSGFSRELGEAGLHEYLQSKSVHLTLRS